MSSRLLWIGLLVALALLRAEQGVAELRGGAAEPSRILSLAPEGHDAWRVRFLGLEGRFRPSDVAAAAAQAGDHLRDGLRHVSGVLR